MTLIPHQRCGRFRPSHSQAKQGFAVVIALSLMAFILLLLLSLTTFVQVESKNSDLSKAQILAQQNALVGMQTAIGEIQRMMGPDQRISAPASVLTAPGYSGSDASLDKQHWVGIWNTSNYDPLQPNTKEFLGWLSSDSHDPLNADNAIPNELDKATSDYADYDQNTDNNYQLMPLVGEGTVRFQAQADPTRVGVKTRVVPFSDNLAGYAWYVSDESTKARVNLHDSAVVTPPTDSFELRKRMFAPRRLGIESVRLEDNSAFPYDPTIASIQEITSTRDLPLLSSQLPASEAVIENATKERYHDLTTYSRGLITNVRDGGLKRDLSAGLGDSTTFNSEFGWGGINTEEFLYSSVPGYTPTLYGPSWTLLRDYATLYRRLSSNTDGINPYGALSHQGLQLTGGNAYAQTHNIYGNSSNDDFQLQVDDETRRVGGTWGRLGVHPIITRLEVAYFVDSELDPATSKYDIRLKTQTLATLVNPYNVPINASNYRFSWQLDPKITVSINDSVLGSTSFEVEANANEGQFLRAYYKANYGNAKTAFKILNTSFAPGEVKVFSFTDSQEMVPGNNDAEAEEGYAANGSRYVYLFDSGGKKFPSGTNTNFADADDLVTVATETPEKDGPNKTQTVNIWFWKYDYNNNEPGAVQNIPFHTLQGVSPTYKDFTGYFGAGGKVNGPISLSQLNAAPMFLWSFVAEARTPNSAPAGKEMRTLANINPRAFTYTDQQGNYFRENAYFFTELNDTEGNIGLAFDLNSSPLTGYWGAASTSGLGSTEVALFDVPREPLISIGQLRHANIGPYGTDPAYVVGSSLAPIQVPRTAVADPLQNHDNGANTFNRWNSRSKDTTVDLSWAVNDALWDDYFFSSVPPADDDNGGFTDYFFAGQTFDQAYIDSGRPLPNNRHLYGENAPLAELRDIDLAAKHLQIDGPFNVNSTSVNAWKAFLASLNGLTVERTNNTSDSNLGNPFPRLSRALQGPGDLWNGPRELADAELQTLAENIVDQVKLRGPFLSMSDFVNRRLVNDDTGLMGALEAAIQNANINANDALTVSGHPSMVSQVHASGLGDDMRPGNISQGDILSALGSLMTTRSDTFKIRVYGESKDPITNETIGTAWCEAVVQRMAEYIRPELNNAEDPLATLAIDNQNFGRKFKVIKFRWLSEEEI